MKTSCTSSIRRKLMLGAAAAMLLTQSTFAQAPAWPTRPVKIVIGTGPGSVTDTIARLYAPRLEAIWKQPVIVENKAGAGGIIGSEYTLASKDGHTLLFASPSMLLAKFTSQNLRFDPETDLVPVYRVMNTPVIFVTNTKTAQSAKTMADMVSLSKTKTDGVFFAGVGPSGFFNVSMALLAKPMGVRYSAIDYNGMGPLTLSVMRDDTQLALTSHLSVKGQLDAKELHAFAVVDRKRLGNLPDVPTLEEAVGYKGFLPISWGGIFVPKGTPAVAINAMAQGFGALYADEAARKSLEARLSANLIQSSPEQFAREYAEEAGVWKNVFATQGIKSQ
ncbi:MAG: Bug family tripartite tricarboxylate transporter substrate binding protein [Betaproteobacteria bacterium]